MGILPQFMQSTQVSQDQLAIPKETMKFVIGTDATYPPMETHDVNGNLIGYDIDLGKELGKGLDREVVFQRLAWDDLFPALEQGNIDVIISSVTINDERKQKYIFSDPYFNAGQVIVMKKTDQAIATPTELKGKIVGVQKETTSEKEAVTYASDSATVRYDDYIQAVASLSAGHINAIIIDLTAAKGLIDTNQNLSITSDPFTKEYYGIAMKKGDTDLQKKINAILLSLKEKGTLDSLKQKWFK